MACSYNIVVVEDEKAICSIMKMVFESNGFNVYIASTGVEAMMMITSHCPDIIILDLGLPDMDGTEIIKKVREWSEIPILVVSARSQEREKVNALDFGADDYITKPFGTSELLARVRAALRHSVKNSIVDGGTSTGEFNLGDMVVDFSKKRVLINGEDVHLTQNEYKIVALLSKHTGKILTYDFLIKSIWGPNMKSDNQILRVNMANIRRKIEADPASPRYIITEIGIGYRMNID